MTGRPTSLTPEVQATILAAIEAGNFKATAAQLAGIHRDTLHGWEQRGAAGEEPFKAFSDALQRAEAIAETALLASIRGAQAAIVGVSGPEPWQAKAWVMERRWPKRWASRVRVAVSEELGVLTEKLRRNLDDETYRRVIDATREDAPGADVGSHGDPH